MESKDSDKSSEPVLLTTGCPTPASATIWLMSDRVRLEGRSHSWTVGSSWLVEVVGPAVTTLRIPVPTRMVPPRPPALLVLVTIRRPVLLV
ncbi:hypothetical protein E2C01_002619 [Portunus trituberculatus]|uniref:Uncharacterized protein n=1 Tax=Portunus trituberculatus TaxID=210409 RepID=A0A5B7CL82_PORTR|nr:hypothetical protein [Portunus trituberculatus]